jgi:lipopolysaccharide export system permease protein
MTTLDRYIIRQFIVNFVILFVVMVGLVIMVELIANFDEFVQAAQRQQEQVGLTQQIGNILYLMADFYGPMIFLYYDYFVGVLPVAAAAFTLAALSRNRELTAMLAGGISLHRVAMPILAMGLAANILAVANQEFALPHFAQKLSRARSDIKLGHIRAAVIRFVPDAEGSLFSAAAFEVEAQSLRELTVLKRQKVGEGVYGRTTERITAHSAHWDDEAAGWRLTGGKSQSRESAEAGVQDLPEGYVLKTDLSPITLLLREKARVRQLLNMHQLNELIANSQTVNIAELMRIKQTRFSLPLINLLILAMGTSFFLLRVPGNLLVQTVKAAPLVIGAWAGGYVMLQTPPTYLPPAAIAWLPIAIYLPQAYWLWDTIET